MNKTVLCLSACMSLAFLSCCKKESCTTCPPNGSTVQLTLDYTACTEIWLKLKFTDSNNPRGFALLRDDRQIVSGTLTTTDTILVDTGVVAGHTYSYTAQRLNGSTATDVSTSLYVRTLDSTSHTIQWSVDTLGAQGMIRDVWVFDRNNAWAVGEIYLRDSSGQIDIAHPYDVAKWNGTQWQLSTSEDIGYLYGQLYCIFAFSPNDIWAGGTIPIHWDGAKWTFYGSTRGYPGGFYINRIFGTSSSNLFVVGTGGNIVYYNGTSWTKMPSNTTVDLQDIWGIDASHVWATGFNNSDGRCVVLQFNGTTWSTIYDSANLPPNKIQYFNTVWANNVNSLYLDGGSYTQILNLQVGTFKRTDSFSTNEVFKIRGTKQNDIFRVGYGGETVHYNGASWYLYPELKTLNGGTAWFYSVFPTSDMVIIGGLFPTALNGFPVVIRGYR